MIKSSKHSIKFTNKSKQQIINQIFDDYMICLKTYVQLILDESLPLSLNLSSKDLPIVLLEHSKWRQSCYKQASEIVRSNLQLNKKRKKEVSLNQLKIDIKNVTLPIRNELFNIKQGKHFDCFIQIITPYRKTTTRFEKINIPIKHHKHSNKFNNWKQKDYINLSNKNNQLMLGFVFEKQEAIKRINGINLAFDSGYKKLLSDSNGTHYGTELFSIYDKLSKKKRGSKNFKQLLRHKKNEINRIINQINLDEVQTVVVEDLKQVKYKSKLSSTLMNKMQYWSYKQVLDKLEDISQLEGFYLIKVNPAYTSQTCSRCGTIDKTNRQGEIYNCSICGLLIDADTNAAINILRRGTYSFSNNTKE